jgi:hypothetical protein
MGFKSWNINELSISLNAIPLSTGGYAEDEVLAIDWTEDWFTKYVGADGEVTRTRTNNFSATATLKYAQTADANTTLSAQLAKDIATLNGAAAGVFTVKDSGGGHVITSPRAWIIAPPQIRLGKTVQVFEWKIDLADARTSTFGGR